MFVVGVVMVIAGISLVVGSPNYPPEAQILVYAAAIALTGNGLVVMLVGWPYGSEPAHRGMAEGTARVIETEKVEGAPSGQHLVEVTFEVRPKHGHRFRVKQRFIDDFSRIKKNQRSNIFYDPDDPSQIRLI